MSAAKIKGRGDLIIPPARSTGRQRTRKTPTSPFNAPAAAPRPSDTCEALRAERVLGMFNGGFCGALRVDLRPLPRHATASRTVRPPLRRRPQATSGILAPRGSATGQLHDEASDLGQHRPLLRSLKAAARAGEELCDPGARAWQQETQKSSCGAAITSPDLQARLLWKSVTRCPAARPSSP